MTKEVGMETPWKSTVAGIINIITGGFCLAAGVLLMLSSELVGMLSKIDWSAWQDKMGGHWVNMVPASIANVF